MSDEPWPIANAIACLKDSKDRAPAGPDGETIRLAMDYAVSIVESINELKPPTPPTPEEVARRAVQQFAGHMATALEELASGLRDIEVGRDDQDWHNPWED